MAQVNARADPLPLRLIEPVETVHPAKPYDASTILQDGVDYMPASFLALVIESEFRPRDWDRLRRGLWIEPAQTPARGHPIEPAARFEKVIDDAARQAMPDAVVGEPVPVEARKPLRRAEPEEAFGIAPNQIGRAHV